MENYTIYMHINKINGKIYIGQTKQSVKDRWGSDGRRYKKQPFYNAIKKYGWDNFEHKIVLEHLTREQANYYEQLLIKKYNSNNKNFGYNVTEGGQTNTLTPQQRELKRQLNYKMWQDGTFKEIINIPVYCIELEQSFESALEAERQLHIDNSAIQKVCKGKLKYTGIKAGQPLHWVYLKDLSQEKINLLKNRSEILKGVSIPIYCVELKKEFNSAAEAANELKLDASSIRKAARGIYNTCGGFHWKSLQNKVNIGNFNGSTGEK